MQLLIYLLGLGVFFFFSLFLSSTVRSSSLFLSCSLIQPHPQSLFCWVLSQVVILCHYNNRLFLVSWFFFYNDCSWFLDYNLWLICTFFLSFLKKIPFWKEIIIFSVFTTVTVYESMKSSETYKEKKNTLYIDLSWFHHHLSAQSFFCSRHWNWSSKTFIPYQKDYQGFNFFIFFHL